MALDSYRADPASYVTDPLWVRELDSVSHREYGTGFYFKSPHEDANTVTMHGYIREKAYLATAVEDSLVPDEDGLYDVYYNEEIALPTLSEMNVKYAYICAVGDIAYPVGNLSEEESKQMTERLFDNALQCEYPQNIDSESIRYIYFGSEDYPYLFYYIHCFKTADGARYIWDRTSEKCVPLGDAFSGILD
jgi:hypothetical protein